jgi:hypothetical protein
MMRGLVFGGALCLVTASSFGQMLDSDFHYYTYANVSHSLIVLGSTESRNGGGFSLAVGRKDPKLTLFRKIEGELIWEGYYVETNTKNPSAQYPYENSQAFGVLATARYRWRFRPDTNFYADLGMGIQFVNHTSPDLPLANNTTPVIGMGLEFKVKEDNEFLFGTRILHASNAGRKAPNPGQNLLQWYVGFRYKH